VKALPGPLGLEQRQLVDRQLEVGQQSLQGALAHPLALFALVGGQEGLEVLLLVRKEPANRLLALGAVAIGLQGLAGRLHFLGLLQGDLHGRLDHGHDVFLFRFLIYL